MTARRTTTIAVILLALTPASAWAQDSCIKAACPANSSVMTNPDPAEHDYYFSCQTAAQSAYVNFAEAAIALSAMGMKPPTMSPTTGDPVLQGKAQARMDDLRAKSGARTLNEAMAHCAKKTQPERVTVLQNPAGSDQLLVRDGAGAQAWMPKGYAEPGKAK